MLKAVQRFLCPCSGSAARNRATDQQQPLTEVKADQMIEASPLEIPDALVVSVAPDSLTTGEETKQTEQPTPDEFYSKFKFTFIRPSSPADIKLLGRAETSKDRFLDLLVIMDCTSSMTSWIELCKVMVELKHLRTFRHSLLLFQRTLNECIDEIKKQHPELQVRVAFLGACSNVFLLSAVRLP